MAFFDMNLVSRVISRLMDNKFVSKGLGVIAGRNKYRRFKVRGHGNYVVTNLSTLTGVGVEIFGSGNKIDFGANLKAADLNIYIRGNNNKIIIGDDCRFIKGGDLWIEDDGCEIIIGDSTSFVSTHLAATESKSKILIGKDCMFAYDIDVRTGDSHSILDAGTGKRINYAKDVNIGNHVWVAAHVRILKGVNVLDNCIVGTGSVVTKSYGKSNVIYAGNPAKVIKENISWTRDRR